VRPFHQCDLLDDRDLIAAIHNIASAFHVVISLDEEARGLMILLITVSNIAGDTALAISSPRESKGVEIITWLVSHISASPPSLWAKYIILPNRKSQVYDMMGGPTVGSVIINMNFTGIIPLAVITDKGIWYCFSIMRGVEIEDLSGAVAKVDDLSRPAMGVAILICGGIYFTIIGTLVERSRTIMRGIAQG